MAGDVENIAPGTARLEFVQVKLSKTRGLKIGIYNQNVPDYGSFVYVIPE